MTGTLYLVAVPIGNLGDITYRAVEVLKTVDFILAEDTRTSQRVLNHYGIQTPFFSSVYQGAERKRVPSILTQLQEGKKLALISDAGTPLISDPGYPLVRAAIDAGHTVTPIPGPCAAIAGLVAAGVPLHRFRFEGMLPRGHGAREAEFASLEFSGDTSVFYESSHRLLDSLELLAEALPDRQIVLARELTKLHEEFLRGTATEVLNELSARDRIRGEFVLIITGAASSQPADLLQAEHMVDALKQEGIPSKTIVKALTRVLDIPRNEAYQLVHQGHDDTAARQKDSNR